GVTGWGGEALISIVSDTGRVEQRGRAFRFDHMPPGRYEIYVQVEGEPMAGYADLAATREINRVNIQLAELSVGFQYYGGRPDDVQVSVRRRDLAGAGPVVQYPRGTKSTTLAPGRWEFRLSMPPDLYPVRLQAPRYRNAPNDRPDGWTEVL